ncbi:hypothetical protein A1OE_422 [Candidatus Endolissoclinum faulkneri L2]|uniref:Uncharacterized protein n=1 Tax=Candidatus Endolissoclinum faulkneri L2 TaxID=1193729 RepID=K7YG84_9PROT|nr:hypothetical protein A1OE_422 [Candidatus Endolissoclinum faulkneri L2]
MLYNILLNKLQKHRSIIIPKERLVDLYIRFFTPQNALFSLYAIKIT